MTPDDFINGIRIRVVDATLAGTITNLKRPPGRHPSQNDIELSNWYLSLTQVQQALLETLVREVSETAAFHLLCVIDGVATIEPVGPKSEFRLMQHAPDGSVTCLNPPDGELLHDIFNAR